MADITRYKPDDKRAVEALYRRVFGNDAAEASRLRWEWQYRHNPNNPRQEPEIWIAREGTTIVGQYATMPVKLSLKGREVQASWGMDVIGMTNMPEAKLARESVRHSASACPIPRIACFRS